MGIPSEAVVYDSRTGDVLPQELVAQGRLEEMNLMDNFGVYNDVPEDKGRGRRV